MVLAFLITKLFNPKIYTWVIISLCCLGFLFVQPQLVRAQANINYAEIRVDELSDAQIRQLILQAQSFGATDAMILQQASARGMKPREVEKLRKRIEQVKIKEGSSFSYELTEKKSGKGFDTRRYRNPDATDSLHQDLDSLDRAHEIGEDYFVAISPQIFGASLFKNSKIKFEPNVQVPTPLDYVVGAGDELLIDIMGDNEDHFELNVGADGYIRVQYLGLVRVGGLTIEQVTSKLKQGLSSIYSGIRTGKTRLIVNLGNIRGVQVQVTGEVEKPGTFTLPSLASVFHALYAAGGPNGQGSYREIKVLRNNEVVQTIDLYEFLVQGIQPTLRIQDNDIIHVPVYQQRVTLLGEVKRTAVYELKNGETFQDVLAYAGGFGEHAYMERVSVIRNSSREKQMLDVDASDFGRFTLFNGDKIEVDRVLDRYENRVLIHGAVFRPGAYGLEQGLTLKGLIEKANGLTEYAFKSRGYIYRLNEDMSKSMIAFDVDQILNQAAADILLKREDEVVIHSHVDLRETQLVSIQGEVRAPGDFEFSAGMSIGELIQQAGGFKIGASPARIEVSRRVRNSDALSSNALTAKIFTLDVDPQLRISASDFRLEPFDMVYVHSAEGYVAQRQVRVEGEVLFPGIYVIQHKNERLSDIIQRAGGLTASAYRDGASLARIRNASSVTNASVFDAQVERHLVGIDMGAILKKPGTQIDLLLEQGDVIHVPKLLQTVTVSGEVLNPNAIVYEPGKRLKSYINGAGGFTSKAYKKRVFVRYANGSAKSAKQFLFFRSYPKVLPGSEIIVPTEPERQLFTAQNWVAISSTLASITAIIVTIMR